MVKITDRIRAFQDAQNEGDTRAFYSFEYYPPKTEAGITKLYNVFDNMQKHNPMWIDVTWGAGGSTADSTFAICLEAKKKGLEVMMHLTCTNMDVSLLKEALKKCKEAGINNILALRGDPPAGQEWKAIEGGFANAVDLVKYIRAEYGDFFCIAVAGYPEGHQDTDFDFELDMKRLKEKVEAGADLIVTQLFYDTDCFVKFVEKCKEMGIQAMVFPGMMPIQTYGGFSRMTTLCKTKVPQSITAALEPIKDDAEKVKAYGVDLCAKMCTEILERCGRKVMGDYGVFGIHFYTLNMEDSTMRILRQLKLIPEAETVFTAVEAAAAA